MNIIAQDDFESPFTDTLSITRRGQSRVYHFTEVTEEQMQRLLDGDQKTFGERLVLACVKDADGQPLSAERFRKLPATVATKLRIKALDVNGEGKEAADKVGES